MFVVVFHTSTHGAWGVLPLISFSIWRLWYMHGLSQVMSFFFFSPSFYLSRQWTGKKVIFVIFPYLSQFCYCALARNSGAWLYLSISFDLCRMDILSCMGRCLFADFRRQVFLSVRYVSRLGPRVSDSIHPIVRSPMFLFFFFFSFPVSLFFIVLAFFEIPKKRS